MTLKKKSPESFSTKGMRLKAEGTGPLSTTEEHYTEPSQQLLLQDRDMLKMGPGVVAGLEQATGSCRCHAPGRSPARAGGPSGEHSWVLIPNTEPLYSK